LLTTEVSAITARNRDQGRSILPASLHCAARRSENRAQEKTPPLRSERKSTAEDCYGGEEFANGSATWLSLGVELVFSQRQRVAAANVIRPRNRKPE